MPLGTLLGGRRAGPDGHRRPLDIDPESQRLWCVGDTDLVANPAVAIIGTRNASPAGAARARRLGRELAREGVVVASGLARGIDTEALQEAIRENGRVFAVIGTPLDRAYPAENAELQRAIYERHLLVSQFPPGARVHPSNFPERDKIMAALTDASVIIEASDTSGTLHQAAECVRLGRWLFVAASVLADPSLTWPQRFRRYERMRPLTASADVLAILSR
jgi:DNA processing protein